MYSVFKKKIYNLLNPSKGGTIWDKFINSFIIGLIILNTLAVILETIESVYNANKNFFYFLEIFTIIFFSIEYILRLWSCTSIPKYRHLVFGRLKYIFSWAALIDLIAILPFYIPIFINYDLRLVRILRLFRFLRFLKLGRYLNASKVMSRVFAAKREELVLSFVITIFLIVIASSLMYFTEHEAQPNKFSSIPETMWWSVATLTTAGSSDVFPITALGKTLTAIISILGIGLFALPAGILASGFTEEFKNLKKGKKVCPHCGKEIEN